MARGLDSVGMKRMIPPARYSGFGNYNKKGKDGKGKRKGKANQFKTYSSESEKSEDSLFGDGGKSNK